MGLFSNKYITYVDAVVYNMAGAAIDRPDFLKTTVSQAALMSGNISDKIISTMLTGPHIDERRFFRWAGNHFPGGLVEGGFFSRNAVNQEAVKTEIEALHADPITVKSAYVASGHISFFAEQYILENRPADYDTDWTAEWLPDSNFMQITYEDGSFDVTGVAGYSPEDDWIVAYYTVMNSTFVPTSFPRNHASTLPTETRSDFPVGFALSEDPADWELEGYERLTELSFYDQDLFGQVREYTVDNSTGEETLSAFYFRPTSYGAARRVDAFAVIYEKFTPVEVNTAEQRFEHIWEQMAVNKIEEKYEFSNDLVDNGDGTSTRTVETRITLPHVWEVTGSRRFSPVYEPFDPATDYVFLYKIGSGNTELDNLVQQNPGLLTEFFPFIPLRNNNKSIGHPDFADEYPLISRAYKKATGGRLGELLDEIEDNPSVGDIDYAFLAFGVEINSPDQDSLEYIYEFLLGLIEYQTVDETELLSYLAWAGLYDANRQELDDWANAQLDELNAAFGDPSPIIIDSRVPEINSFRMQRTNVVPGYPKWDFRMEWNSLDEDTGTGLLKPDAEAGDIWWQVEDPLSIPTPNRAFIGAFLGIGPQGLRLNELSVVTLNHQLTDNSWRKITCIGLRHINYVHRNTFADVDAATAIADGEESGFFFPLHMPTLRRMPLVKAHQVATQNRLILFNTYVTQKVKWYKRGVFKFVLPVLAIAIGAFFAPAGVGLLGANAVVGAALGYTGTAALIIGAAVNAVAAMALMMVLEVGLGALFGDDLGSILAVVAMFVVGMYATSFHASGSWVINWGDMLRMDNLMKLVDVTGKAIKSYADQKIDEIGEELVDAKSEYEKRAQEIEDRTAEILGLGGGMINPLWFTEMLDSSAPLAESRGTFLDRTLMTGTDLIDISMSMIHDFPELSKKLPKSI